MKKILSIILTLVFTLCLSVGCKPTNDDNTTLSLYCPDGAPALSVARLIDNDNLVNVDINVIPASTINGYVTGEAPKADIAIMPVNAASKLLGSASTYQMLGVVTSGNLFILKKQTGVEITSSNLQTELIGKKVGVINLANVPGLTFKAILADNNVPYCDFSGEVDSAKVNLVGLADGTAVTPHADCDYFVVPEPAATTKINATQGKLSLAGSLQTLYGDGNGYPQAVLVAKKSVIANYSDTINSLISSFADNYNWLVSNDTSAETIVNAIVSALPDGTAPTFTANNLNKTVIANCGIGFINATNSKASVLAYLNKINGITANSFGVPVDGFFYVG